MSLSNLTNRKARKLKKPTRSQIENLISGGKLKNSNEIKNAPEPIHSVRLSQFLKMLSVWREAASFLKKRFTQISCRDFSALDSVADLRHC
jgi:hypothetical protein